MPAYYNENDPKAAAWLRELIKEGHIAPGYVDERSIIDVRPHELTPYAQQHFFAGIGGWSLALRLAGWPDDEPVRTGSCPCQPFSAAGRQLGEKDERHLWPVFRDLITFGEPTVTFGEQVASKLGRDWLDGVRADLENLGYAVGAADLCAAGLGAPHIRQRLWWVANPDGGERRNGRLQPDRKHRQQPEHYRALRLADAQRNAAESRGASDQPGEGAGAASAGASAQFGRRGLSGGLGDSGGAGLQERGDRERGAFDVQCPPAQRTGPWSHFDIIPCADGKARRVEPGTFPLAHGVSGRVGLLRGYGNAIVPQVAATFIRSYLEAVA